MLINNKEVSVDSLIKELNIESDYIKRRSNGLYLSDNQIEVLRKYDIHYEKYTNLNSLIFEIEEILNEQELEDLEEVSSKLAELKYYNNTNK